ncbi:MAG TPA: hypothetical protein VJN18_19375 [Polyangiaceae bacterium]|nr:hypothetical protein [Polyangiaceae bacterium]
MRDYGIPKLLTWRWTPCAALVLGALSFVGFALLAIPDRIGDGAASGTPSLKLGNRFSRSPSSVEPSADFSDDGATDSPPPSPATRLASRGNGEFPKRGFTPPLDRPAPAAVPPQPQLSPPPVPAEPPAAAEPQAPPPAPPPPAPEAAAAPTSAPAPAQ